MPSCSENDSTTSSRLSTRTSLSSPQTQKPDFLPFPTCSMGLTSSRDGPQRNLWC